MKKTTAILMTLVLAALCCLSVPAMAASTPTFVWEDCALQLLSYKITKYSETDSPNMYLYGRLINNKDYKLYVLLRDTSIDGVSVVGGIFAADAKTDTGTEDLEFALIFPSKDNKEAGSNAIISARVLNTTLEFTNKDNEVLCSQKISIDLDVLEGVRDIVTTKPTEKPTPIVTSTPAPDNDNYGNGAPPYNPSSYNFTGLKRGSKGQAVKDLQQRLTDLGYLNDKVDGEYGLSTAIAVMSFCDQNGLYIQPDATVEMQTLVYSAGVEYYKEPWIPLIFGPEYKWDNPLYVDIDNGTFYIQLVNRTNRTIRGYELYYYFTDVWGNRYLQNGIELTRKTVGQESIKPGYCVYSIPITVYPFSWTYAVNIGIHRIIFDDGEIREIDPKEVNYWTCPIKN